MRHLLPYYKERQIDDIDLLGLTTKLFGLLALTTSRNNNRREKRRYDNHDHRHDNKSKSSRARQFYRHRSDFRPKISTLLIFYLFMHNIFYYYPSKQLFLDFRDLNGIYVDSYFRDRSRIYRWSVYVDAYSQGRSNIYGWRICGS